jgi:hypothetical protein
MLTDPDDLVDPTNIVIDTSGKTVQLVVAGSLTSDGVTLKCVYSKLKELWKSSSTYIKFPFPMSPITDEQFEMVNGWDWEDDTTRYLLRNGGWALKDTGGVSQEEWAGIISLGSIGGTDQAYFLQSSGGSTANFQLTGAVNQAVKIYGDVTHGSFDYRSYFKIYCRIYQKTYAFSQLSDIGATVMTYQAYRFPLANASDPKITHDDTYVEGNAPYTGMTITWYGTAQTRDIGGTDYDFHVIIDGNSGTAEQIFEFVQHELRQATDIDDGAGTQTGKKTGALLRFVGDTLYTVAVTEGGVFIDNYLSNDVNRLVFVDDLGAELTFPYTAVLTINFGDNLVNDADARYWVYFTNDDSGSNLGYDYGTSNAILVDTSNAVTSTHRACSAANVATITTATAHGLVIDDIVRVAGIGGSGYNGIFTVSATSDGTHFSYALTHAEETETADTGGTLTQIMGSVVDGDATVTHTFAYDTNIQRGNTLPNASPTDDAPITVVGIGLETGQFVKATGNIARSITNSISLVAPLERNYQNA